MSATEKVGNVGQPIKRVCADGRLRVAWELTQSDQSSLCTQYVTKDQSFPCTDNEDSDQTDHMSRPSLPMTHSHIVEFLMSQLMFCFLGKNDFVTSIFLLIIICMVPLYI